MEKPSVFQTSDTRLATDEQEVLQRFLSTFIDLIDADGGIIAREDDGSLRRIDSPHVSGESIPDEFSRVSLPARCRAKGESCKIDDLTDARSTSSGTVVSEAAFSGYKSLVITPFGDTDVLILGAREANAFDEADVHLIEGAVRVATAHFDSLKTSAQSHRLQQIAAVLSHDVDNLILTLEGNLELLEDEVDPETYERLRRTVDRLKQLINDTVRALRLQEDSLEIETVELGQVVAETWEIVASEEMQLIAGDLGYVRADESKLCQILENLLRNAVDHADSSGTVWVGRTEKGFYIEDSGPGIPEAKRDRIFEYGYSSVSENTGFGLTIVRDLVEMHGWEISVKDAELGGARFEISGVDFTADIEWLASRE